MCDTEKIHNHLENVILFRKHITQLQHHQENA